jgi:hypothetical protein
MPVFVPPTENAVAYGDPFKRGIEWRLWRFYAPTLRGINVYRLNDGTFVEVQPRDMSTVSRMFFGGHHNYVTDVEADALVAAGYTVLPGVFEVGSSYSSTLGSDAVLGV